MLAAQLEETVANLLLALGLSFKRGPTQRFDYVFTDKRGKSVALEVKPNPVHANALLRLRERFAAAPGLDAFVLLSPASPDRREKRLFTSIFGQGARETHWLGSEELPGFLGYGSPVDLSSPETQARLQLNAFNTNIDRYSREHIGPEPAGLPRRELRAGREGGLLPRRRGLAGRDEPAGEKAARDYSEYQLLSRQFSYSLITRLLKEGAPIEKLLKVGDRVSDAIVVLSDIKNFSALAKAARPEDLNETMSDYYRRVRDLVWKHGGALDKFIGDAALAVFNYPLPSASAPLDSLRFAAELVLIGRHVLGELQEKLDEKIDTGTRVGITCGDLWVLNISKAGIEVSFVGDKINLAARLEKACKTDGVLISNRLRNLLAAADYDFARRAVFEKRSLEPQEAKGQITEIITWQLAFESLAALVADEGGDERVGDGDDAATSH